MDVTNARKGAVDLMRCFTHPQLREPGSEHWPCPVEGREELWVGSAEAWARLPWKGAERLSTVHYALGQGTGPGGPSQVTGGFHPYLLEPEEHWTISSRLAFGEVRSSWGDAIRFTFQKAHSGCQVENEFLGFDNWPFICGIDCLVTMAVGCRMTSSGTWRHSGVCMASGNMATAPGLCTGGRCLAGPKR